ncbi:MAG TPA: lipoyl synthase [Anaeromyxobacteraceae bacterium]|nr:lipoyl synthase [Anaeromyxobacteraceae bacterium]
MSIPGEIGRSAPWTPPRPRVTAGVGPRFEHVRATLVRLGLPTVCRSARCPNVGECWSAGTATVMLLGEACTRGCRFCAVRTLARPPPPDPGEPRRVAEAVRALGLGYVVVTSVDRDDLPDGGAGHFAETIRRLAEVPGLRVEVLTPDFRGDPEAVRAVARAGPDVFATNVETTRRLTPRVRDRRAGYEQTLAVLAQVRREFPGIVTKSSLMVGLGERQEEVEETLRDLRRAGVEIVTIGQYLRPSGRHLPVTEWVSPAAFGAFAAAARRLGFRGVASGPLVRSSYRAGELFARARGEKEGARVAGA